MLTSQTPYQKALNLGIDIQLFTARLRVYLCGLLSEARTILKARWIDPLADASPFREF